jgi:hypothetical protein
LDGAGRQFLGNGRAAGYDRGDGGEERLTPADRAGKTVHLVLSIGSWRRLRPLGAPVGGEATTGSGLPADCSEKHDRANGNRSGLTSCARQRIQAVIWITV